MRAGVRLARIHVQVEGREHIPAEPSIFMSNHVSNLDPPIILPFLPFRTAFFIKRSLLKIPLVGYGMRLAGFIPGGSRWTLGVGAGKRSSRQQGFDFRGQHLYFSRGHTLARRQIAAFQKGTFLSRHGVGRADYPHLHLGFGAHDDQGQPAHQARNRAPDLSPGCLPPAICHPRAAGSSRSGGHHLSPAAMDVGRRLDPHSAGFLPLIPPLDRQKLLLDDGVVSVGEQLLLDDCSLRAVRKRPHLDV